MNLFLKIFLWFLVASAVMVGVVVFLRTSPEEIAVMHVAVHPDYALQGSEAGLGLGVVLVERPVSRRKFALAWSPVGFAKFARLVTLKTSQRNCSA